jgi:2-(1,2-epoxy-1,2-dihydrophenyl)acetyl-CoA isomerase
MPERPVLLEIVDHVATITLNRPERLNAMNSELVEDLLATLRRLVELRDARVVVLTGAGRGFCAGGDVGALAEGSDATRTDDFPARTREYMQIDELLHFMDKPVIAAVNGPCAGAGVSMAAACDLRYAAESAVFATAFLRVGQSGDHGGIWSLTRAVGPAKARELFLLGERITAEEALRIGLVHGVVPDSDLIGRVAEIATRLSRAAPAAVRAMKANLNDALELGFSSYVDRETQRFVEVSGSADAVEAARAFIEKRDPVFGDG